jgi:signal transduction histidine kinase
MRRLAALALEHHGFEVACVPDVASALASARACRPDLVLSDVAMESVDDGYRLVEAMRAEPTLEDLPIILMTGAADLAGLRRGMSLGADDYLPKPFSSDELVRAVDRRLERHADARRPAEARLAELRQSVSTVVPHELLTPLNGILGVAQLLEVEADTLTPDEVREYAGMLRTSGERLSRIVKNVVAYTHLDVVRADPARRAAYVGGPPIVAAPVVQRMASACARAAGRLGDLAFALDEVHVAIRAESLEAMVTELVKNACEFSPAGTPIRVALGVDRGGVALVVEDRGRGFPAGFASRLGAFVQFDRDKHEQQGAGLGLAIVRRTAELFGGRVHIDSEPGGGAAVRVTLRGGSIGGRA